MKKAFYAVFCCWCFHVIHAQTDSIFVIDQSDLENIVENDEIEGDLDIFNTWDQLSYFAENPLNINKATYDELNFLNLLHQYQILALLDYRQKFGDLISIYELQAIPGWNLITIERVRPFITVRERTLDREEFKNMLSAGNHEIVSRVKRVMQQRAGFDPMRNPQYLGDAHDLFFRYQYNYGNKLRWGYTGEKDPGELIFRGINNHGFDFNSAFVHYYDPRTRIKSVSLGDYTISMGQGLILHNTFGSGKSTQVINIKRGGRPIRPYTSINETNFFRGGATTLQLSNQLEVTAFYSRKRTNGTASIDTTLDDGFETFTSINPSGFHRTQSEIDRKGTITQVNTGGIVQFNSGGLRLGANYLNTSFDRTLVPTDFLYRQFAFSGNTLDNYSTDISYRYKNFNFFSEAAMSGNGGTALLSGVQAVLHPKLDIAILYRDYSKDYQVIQANAFGEAGQPVNERGLYFGAEFRLSRSYRIALYHDTWYHPWLRFRVDAPNDGHETFVRFEYTKRRKHFFYFQYRHETKGINITTENPIRTVDNRHQHRFRAQFNNIIFPGLELRNRIEYVYFKNIEKVSTGWLLFQDILYRPPGKKYAFSSRLAFFDTDDFDSRIYAFENDILYEFRIPFFQNRGMRFYLNSRYKINRNLTAELRFENTYFDNVSSIGSSGETILGNNRSEVKLQFRYRR